MSGSTCRRLSGGCGLRSRQRRTKRYSDAPVSSARAQASSVAATPYFLASGKHAQDAAHGHLSLALVQSLTQRADVRSGGGGTVQEPLRAGRSSPGTVFVFDPMAAALLAQVLPQQLAGERIDQADLRLCFTAPERGARSSREVRHSRPLPLRRSRSRCTVRWPYW